jgi:hypothetical protein
MTSNGRASARAPRFLVLLGLVSGALWGKPVLAQSLVSGSLRGQVLATDSSGVIGAQVTITNPAAGSSYAFFADRRGQFSLALVIPGTYDILAEQAGTSRSGCTASWSGPASRPGSPSSWSAGRLR